MSRPFTRSRIGTTIKPDFSDVLIKPTKSSLSSRSQVNLNVRYTFKHSKNIYEGIPIVSSNMDTISTARMYNELSTHGLMTCFSKHFDDYELCHVYRDDMMISMGTEFGSIINHIQKFSPKYVCIDVANGYMDALLHTIDKFKKLYQHRDITLCVGNVVTPERVETLIRDFGVDIVKVGIGSGGVCSTRMKTGVGYPQFSCVRECADAAREHGGYLMSDGGIRTPSDIAKAFGAGADFVMVGSILAGHDECEGDVVYTINGLCMRFYGMSSKRAMEKYSGGVNSYRSPEGEDILVEYKGPVKNTVLDILGGLRSTCTYTGNPTLSQFIGNAEFIKVNKQK